ncbi:N-acetylglucosamine-6-phosphate deacetylase [Actinoallomurus iriomotensis]|uniref:N-acetylglucosamine-6-phosphate deacetylase n=1 Tax=Actinoallomurus iriomotensis TaxID=478107 RepID=A0A9W6VT55_9ACTN|nr:N-acetylglucosamine-6-phosphate deacetylase [Actinoallomurus iriomotensis]GLY79385.1 N-acetylglucosamine-6-phosphate deacetylase [Actinoallomurus iriomotensis]
MTVLSADRVVALDGVLEPGWVEVADGRITAVGHGVPEHADLHGAVIVPGFVDLHCHGGGGASFDSADPGECARAAAFHRERGTTTLVASLVTAAPDVLERRASVLSELAADGVVAGIHYEGPFLSPARKGAHDPTLLRDPDAATVERLLRVPHVRMMTIAPELDGGLDALRRVREAGALPAVGHTDATYEVTREAVRAGARVATHLFNGMRPLHHREPGPILALLDAPDVVVELIGDGTHLHPAVVGHAARTAGTGRAALVTDSIAAAGMSDGEYELGGLGVEVREGVARLTDGGSIAGSTATAAEIFRRAVRDSGLSLEEAVRMSATTPAALLGLSDRGAVSPGLRADLLVLDDDLGVRKVLTA